MEPFDRITESMDSFLSTVKIEAPKDDENKMWEYIEKSQISFYNPINKPPAILSIRETNRDRDIPIFTAGNFSLFKGAAKSRKTFGLSMIATSLAYNMNVYDKFIPHMRDKVILFIDTEQSDYHVYRFVNSVVNMSETRDQPNTFRALCLRPYETSMRLKLVEFLIYNAKNLGYVIIDGIRDLITDINSQEEAKMITDKLLKWTKEKDIHISCVLHENKEGGKARGHIGTELVNKAETVIKFEKNAQDKSQSIISAEDTRGEDFEPIYFSIERNENGLYPLINEKNEYSKSNIPERF